MSEINRKIKTHNLTEPKSPLLELLYYPFMYTTTPLNKQTNEDNDTRRVSSGLLLECWFSQDYHFYPRVWIIFMVYFSAFYRYKLCVVVTISFYVFLSLIFKSLVILTTNSVRNTNRWYVLVGVTNVPLSPIYFILAPFLCLPNLSNSCNWPWSFDRPYQECVVCSVQGGVRVVSLNKPFSFPFTAIVL